GEGRGRHRVRPELHLLRSLQLAPADRGHALSPEAWIPLCDGGRLHLRRRPTHLCGDPGHCAGGLSIREFFVRRGAVRSRERAAHLCSRVSRLSSAALDRYGPPTAATDVEAAD